MKRAERVKRVERVLREQSRVGGEEWDGASNSRRAAHLASPSGVLAAPPSLQKEKELSNDKCNNNTT